MSKAVYRVLAAFIFLVFVGFFAAFGGGIGMAVNSFSNVTYESKAMFRIGPEWIIGDKVPQATIDQLLKIAEMPHDQHFASKSNIKSCLVKNNLFVLDSFVDLSAEQVVDLVESNLIVSKPTPNSNIIKLVYHSSDPQDSATILNNLIKHYHDELSEPEIHEHVHFVNLEVARVGNQISPNLAFNFPIGVCSGILFGITFWFLLNPFKLNPHQYSVLQIALLFIAVSACFAVGVMAVRMTKETLYASTATISITDDANDKAASATAVEQSIAQFAQEPHDFLIRQYHSIESALEKNNLFVLDSFVDLAKEEVILYVQDNLKATTNEENPGTIEISYRSPIPIDAELVLDALTKTYLDGLQHQNEKRQNKRSLALNNETDAADESLAFGIPKQYQSQLIQPASKATKTDAAGPLLDIPAILAGLAAAVLCLVVCLAIWLSRGGRSLPQVA